ncbi:DNA-binding protein [Caballeronia sp. LZ016]|uniref:DNA-binding protein n=1 Tax=Caballeronia sp. LZ016 TaxID=3038554 RepID=UPI00285A1033|nr:DNA-binding protein [Caballeronia sp. LZ016]MDR5740154.1 DNA-binding protein [Caballeronia sp. LZ016]
MSDVLSDESRLAADIERLKVEFPKTRELYREVCALLFFRFGVAPTANRLYNLVRRGTMSTPASVLGEFWAELREKSRVRIEHPDLPTDLREVAGELIGTLWTRAIASAEAQLTALREEVEAAGREAEQKVVAAREELARTETALEQRTAALLAAQVEIRELERQQAEESATRKALEAQIKRLGDEAVARERELEKVRDTFSRDLEKLRETASRAEERLRATEKRALLEIDRERSAVAKAQKELTEAAKRADKREAEHRRTVDALQAQQGDARHQNGVLQGKLAALEAAHHSLQEQFKSLSTTARPTARRVSTAEAGPPARRVVRKAAVGKTARAKGRP